jgi:hypothetical protein
LVISIELSEASLAHQQDLKELFPTAKDNDGEQVDRDDRLSKKEVKEARNVSVFLNVMGVQSQCCCECKNG